LLVTGKSEAGDPQGVSPDMAAEIAKRLSVPVAYVNTSGPRSSPTPPAPMPGISGLIGAEPQRAEKDHLHGGYCEIGRLPGCRRLSPANHWPMSIARPACGSRCGAARLTISGSSATSARHGAALGQCRRSLNQFISEGLEAYAGAEACASDRRREGAGQQDLAGQLHDASRPSARKTEYRRCAA